MLTNRRFDESENDVFLFFNILIFRRYEDVQYSRKWIFRDFSTFDAL